MVKLPEEVAQFLHHQNFVIVSTLESNGNIHCVCKGIFKIDKNGKIYLMDLYRARTLNNLTQNPHISITAVDEHRFRGYCLKGKARILKIDNVKSDIIAAWESKLSNRITQRVLRNMRGEKGHPHHPESLLPRPEYVIVMEVEDIINLTPQHIKV